MEQERVLWLQKEKKKGNFVQCLSDIVPSPKVDFKVGDKVVYTNDYGVSFAGLTIIAISNYCNLWKYGHCIYLDKDGYWFPVKPESLTIQYDRTKM